MGAWDPLQNLAHFGQGHSHTWRILVLYGAQTGSLVTCCGFSIQSRILKWFASHFCASDSSLAKWNSSNRLVRCSVDQRVHTHKTPPPESGVQEAFSEWCVCAKLLQSCSTRSNPVRLLCPWNSPGKNTGVGCHALLQGIKPTSLACPALQMDSLLLSHWGSHQWVVPVSSISCTRPGLQLSCPRSSVCSELLAILQLQRSC